MLPYMVAFSLWMGCAQCWAGLHCILCSGVSQLQFEMQFIAENGMQPIFMIPGTAYCKVIIGLAKDLEASGRGV